MRADMQFSITEQVDLTTSAKQIVESDHSVYIVKITNLSAVDVYIGFNFSVSSDSGDLLIGIKGSFLIVETSSSIYASAAASAAKISYLLMRKN